MHIDKIHIDKMHIDKIHIDKIHIDKIHIDNSIMLSVEGSSILININVLILTCNDT